MKIQSRKEGEGGMEGRREDRTEWKREDGREGRGRPKVGEGEEERDGRREGRWDGA